MVVSWYPIIHRGYIIYTTESYINFSSKNSTNLNVHTTNLNPMDNSSGESIFFFCGGLFLFFSVACLVVLLFCVLSSCALWIRDQGQGKCLRSAQINPPQTARHGGYQSHGAIIAMISRWTKGPGITGGRPKDEADPPQPYWPPSMHPCFNVFVRPSCFAYKHGGSGPLW